MAKSAWDEVSNSVEDSVANRKKEYEQRLSQYKKYENDKVKVAQDAEKLIEIEEKERHKKSLKDKLAQDQEYYNDQLKLATNASEKISAILGASLTALAQTGTALASKVSSDISQSLESSISTYSKYMSSINTRMQGTGNTFSDMSEMIRNNTNMSPYVKQSAVLENLSTLVSKGIAYNVEQRAFLATISDKIAETFDVANGTLLRLIRIQQADSTVARLGIEAALTRFLNSSFSDTSYLNNGYTSTISSMLLDTESLMGTQASAEFEYTAQKWLGSLSSVGVSSSTIESLAQGLNYLGTGNISGLSSNTALQNLLVMAANRAGIDYASILTGGLDASTANKLLQGVVSFGQDIASNTNNVVKSQYAQLFGLTISDMTALLNLSSQDLVAISKNMLTYSDMIDETEYQLSQVGSRMNAAEMVENVYSNVIAGITGTMADNPALYMLYKAANFVQEATGNSNINFMTMGSGANIIGTATEAIKLGTVGLSALASFVGGISSLFNGGSLNLENWGAKSVLSTGVGFTGINRGSNQTTSQTMYIGNSSEDAIYESSIAGAKERTTSITGQEEDAITVAVKAIRQTLDGWNDSGYLKTKSINSIYDPSI